MTPQQIDAMKLALEALEQTTHAFLDTEGSHGRIEQAATDAAYNAITALEEVLAEHAMREVQRLGREIEEIEYCTVYHCAGDCGQPHNQEEMSEFFAVQPEQEPVAWMDADGNVSDNNDHKCFPIPLYTKEQP